MRMFDCLKKHFDPRLWKEASQAQGKCAVRLQLPGRCKPGTVCHLYNIDKGGVKTKNLSNLQNARKINFKNVCIYSYFYYIFVSKQ